MFKVFVVYEGELDADRYEQHVELCHRVPGATFRHGKVLGAPMGAPKFTHYAEFEFPDRETFDNAMRSAEMGVTGKDAMAMGVPMSVHFAEVS